MRAPFPMDQEGSLDMQMSALLTAESSTTLLSEATVLLKSLKSLKAMKLKQINADADTSCRPVGLLDGGATHGLRMAYASEINQLEQVDVELASGTAFLYRHPAQKTLLSKTPIEPIVPLHRFVHMGYKIEWSASGCKIFHPSLGVIQCYLRNGCPVMDRDGALEILKEMERLDSGGVDLQADELRWWKGHFPLVPDRVLKRLRGQGEEWDPDLLPWNRRQRRAHARRGVAIHLFSGSDTKKWIRPEVGDWEWIFIDTCLGSQFDLHRPVVWSYLWSLASRGLVKLVMGGPPCRTVSRLRNKGPPGPRRGQRTRVGKLFGEFEP